MHLIQTMKNKSYNPTKKNKGNKNNSGSDQMAY